MYKSKRFFALSAFGALACVPACAGGDEDASSSVDALSTRPTPIEHVIVIVKENHTFDNYFGTFPGAEGTSTYTTSDGKQHPMPRANQAIDMCHTADCAVTGFRWHNGGARAFHRIAK